MSQTCMASWGRAPCLRCGVRVSGSPRRALRRARGLTMGPVQRSERRWRHGASWGRVVRGATGICGALGPPRGRLSSSGHGGDGPPPACLRLPVGHWAGARSAPPLPLVPPEHGGPYSVVSTLPPWPGPRPPPTRDQPPHARPLQLTCSGPAPWDGGPWGSSAELVIGRPPAAPLRAACAPAAGSSLSGVWLRGTRRPPGSCGRGSRVIATQDAPFPPPSLVPSWTGLSPAVSSAGPGCKGQAGTPRAQGRP